VKHQKQEDALMALTDNDSVEILFGGSAGGAKSWTGCVWLAFSCVIYPETKWFIGREELKRLRESTLITFFKVCKMYGIVAGEDFTYNGQDHYIQFKNGSRIDLLELKQLPSDPLYERLGSTEYTGGMIDEGGEIAFGAFDTLKSRIGRHLNDKYKLTRKIFVTCNPKRNWLYQYFYRASIENRLAKYQRFIRSGIFDNPHIETSYVDALRSITDPVKKARLLDGSWEYSDDPAALCDYDCVLKMFENIDVDYDDDGEKIISADLAMKGRDRFVAGVWIGFVCKIAIDQEKSSGKSIEEDLRQLMLDEDVEHHNVVVDSDGMGSYLESYLEGIREFHGGASAITEEYANLKSECAYKLAELINKNQIRIICSFEQRQKIIEEVMILKAESVDADEKKKRIIKKEKMKEYLQRSPDYLDMLLMRMMITIDKRSGLTWVAM
jgi:phage terminase large subunit